MGSAGAPPAVFGASPKTSQYTTRDFAAMREEDASTTFGAPGEAPAAMGGAPALPIHARRQTLLIVSSRLRPVLIVNHQLDSAPDLPRIALRVDRLTLAKRRWRATAEDGAEFGFDLAAPMADGTPVHATDRAVY